MDTGFFESLNLSAVVVFAALGALSFLAVTVGVFKWFQFLRLGVGRRKQAEAILDNWLSGQPDAAIRMAEAQRSVLARILRAVFTCMQERPNEPSYAEELGRQSAMIELARMSDRMHTLEMIVQAAPMLGLLGTVIGMIDAFSALSISEGAVDPAVLAGGIYTALITTAVGLAVALVAFFTSTLFEARIERERTLIETLLSAAIYGRVNSGLS